MAFFPFMIQLDNVNCLVVGGGKVAQRKIEILQSFGAIVYVVATEINEAIYTLANNNSKIIINQRRVIEEDLDNKEVVIMATNDSELNSRYSSLCKEKRILVNVVDVKKDCGFYFPAIIKQDEVVIGISTGGSSPLLAARIKKDIQSSIRTDYGIISSEMESIRENALTEIKDDSERFKYLQKELEIKLKNDN